MAGLPTTGGSESAWGTELNDFLSVFLNTADGKPKVSWAYVSESSGTYTLEDSYNIASIAKISTGRIRITLDSYETFSKYAMVGTVAGTSSRVIHYDDQPRSGRMSVYITDTAGNLKDEAFSIALILIEEA